MTPTKPLHAGDAKLRLWHAVIHSITGYFRRRRGAMIRAFLPDIARFEVCDLGGSRHFWDNSDIGVPPERLTLFNVDQGETGSAAGSPYERARFVVYDGRRIPVADGQFDLLVCNSVIEHVPVGQRGEFVLEMRRVARRIVLQTPAKAFPIEPHFLLPFVQWLPKSIGRYAVRVSPWRLLSRPTPDTLESYYAGTNLLTEAEVRALFPDAELRFERFLGLRKSYVVFWPGESASPEAVGPRNVEPQSSAAVLPRTGFPPGLLKRVLQIMPATITAAVLATAATVVTGQADGFITADHFRTGAIRGLGIGPARQERDEYFEALAATGANVGRLFFAFTRCKTCADYQISAGEIYNLDSMLESARRHRIALILVATFAEDERGAWWTDERLWQPAGLAWESLARRYQNEPAVAAYELFNEPIVAGKSLQDAVAQWSRLTEGMIRAVRGADRVHPIIVQPPQGGSGASFELLRPFSDPGIVYSFHYYIPHQITHQKVSAEWQRVIPYPAGAEYGLGTWDPRDGAAAWNRERMSKTLAPVREFARRHRAPVFVGEFSCVRWAPDGAAYRYVRDVLELIRAERWSWAYHEFRGWPGWDPEIAGDDPADRRRDPNAPMMRLLKEALAPRSAKSQ